MAAGVVLPDAPESIAGQRLFAVHDIEFTVADVARRAHLGDRGLVSPPGGSGAVQEAFRRAQRLLTADHLTHWLATWAISPEEFQHWSENPTEDTTWAALVCSGTLDRAASEVAAAAAAACELGAPPTSAAWFDPTGWTERLAAQAATPDAVAAVIRQHRLGWTSVRAVGVLARARAVAEELRHWVLHDGLDLEIAAVQAGAATFRLHAVLEQIDSAVLRAALSGARRGELVGPTATDRGWAVLRVENRTEPHSEDPAILARAAEAVRTAAVERAVLRHVAV